MGSSPDPGSSARSRGSCRAVRCWGSVPFCWWPRHSRPPRRRRTTAGTRAATSVSPRRLWQARRWHVDRPVHARQSARDDGQDHHLRRHRDRDRHAGSQGQGRERRTRLRQSRPITSPRARTSGRSSAAMPIASRMARSRSTARPTRSRRTTARTRCTAASRASTSRSGPPRSFLPRREPPASSSATPARTARRGTRARSRSTSRTRSRARTS